MKHEESRLQIECVKWFSYQYPHLDRNLFAIPNGEKRGIITATILKRQGVKAGVADIFLAMPKSFIDKYESEVIIHGLFIEFKTDKGKQNENQITFQKAVTTTGYRYVIVRSFDEFKELIEDYLE